MREVDGGLCELSVVRLHSLISAGAVNRTEIVRAHLDRISVVNPRVNTFVELREQRVLAEAQAADRAHGRQVAGPLDGVPVSIKDNIAVAGLPTTLGVKAFAHQVASEDAPAVARIKQAGGLVLGHANVPDFLTRWNTVSDLYGTARNPRDPRLSVGGSSGGDAGNVAAGMAVLGLGGDFFGSIRVPASFCGVYGLRTSQGVIPQVPFPWGPPNPALEEMATTGPLARTAADLEAALNVASGPHPADPASAPIRLKRSMGKPRIAVLETETGARLSPEVSANLEWTVNALRDAGFDVRDNVLPNLRRAADIQASIMSAHFHQLEMREIGALFGETGLQHSRQLNNLFSLGPDLRPYLEAWLERRELMQKVALTMADYPLVVAPAAGIPAPPLDFDHLLDAQATRALFDHMRCIPWVNLCGLPALTLPNGIQLVGTRYSEYDLIATAKALEPALGPVEIADGALPNTADAAER